MPARDRLVCHHCPYVRPEGGDETQCPDDGTWLVTNEEHRCARLDPLLGRTVGGRYPLLAVLGSGAMGTVYRSIQPLVERPVAIKVVSTGRGGVAQAEVRFQREAKAVASLAHPAIVTLYDFGVDPDGTAYMVMEHVRGTTLASELDRGSFPPRLFLDLVLEVLDALAVAHGHGLVHRDLKPDNVMVLAQPTQYTRVKVLDFGLAKLLGPDNGEVPLTHVGAVCGTPAYISPEQFLGAEADARSDLYAVGVILYEGLVGRLPFEGDATFELMRAHVEDEAPPLPDEYPPELRLAVARALAKSRGHRFQTAAELAEALRAGRAGLPGDLEALRTLNRPLAPSVSRSLDGSGASLFEPPSLPDDLIPTRRHDLGTEATTEAAVEDLIGDNTILELFPPPGMAAQAGEPPSGRGPAPGPAAGGVLEPWSPPPPVRAGGEQPEQPDEPDEPEQPDEPDEPGPMAPTIAAGIDEPATEDTITFVPMRTERSWGRWVVAALALAGVAAGLVAVGGPVDGPASVASPPPPAAARHQRPTRPTVVAIRSEPSGASVMQGGDLLGVTPLTVRPRGAPGEKARLRLLLRGFRPARLGVTLDGTEQEHLVALVEVPDAGSGPR